MTSPPSKGLAFECRIARLLQAEGAFVRRRVNLDAHFGERFTITDVDILATYLSPTLALRTVAGECKTTDAKSAPSAGDRLLWASGLARLAAADAAFLAISKHARDSERHVASLVGAELLDIRDVERRERIQALDKDAPYGAHDPVLDVLRETAGSLAKQDEDIRRIYRFVTSELWLIPAVPKLKKALGAARLLSQRWAAKLPDAQRKPLEWMLSEALIGSIVALVLLAGAGYRQPEDVFEQYLQHRLAEGLAGYDALREISRQVDRVLIEMLPRMGVDAGRAVEITGFFEPRPPGYAEPLSELLERLARDPQATSKLPLLADARYATFLGADGSTEERISGLERAPRLLRLIAAFFEGQIRVPSMLLDPLRLQEAGRSMLHGEQDLRVSESKVEHTGNGSSTSEIASTQLSIRGG
jgi:hypothetical protein